MNLAQRSALAVFLASALLGFTGTAAGATNHKHSPDLETADPASTLDVIVQFKTAPTAKLHRKLTARRGIFQRNLGLVNGAHYTWRRRNWKL